MSRTALSLVALLGVVVSLPGCGVDEDALICAPGRERAGEVCVDVESDDIGDADEDATPPLEAGDCSQWFQCDPSYHCDARDAPGRCRLRCDAAGAPSCAEGLACTSAGVCLPLGALGLDEPCGASPSAHCDAERHYACPLDGERVCRPVCDLQAPARDCRNDEQCQPQPEGFGVCVPQ